MNNQNGTMTPDSEENTSEVQKRFQELQKKYNIDMNQINEDIKDPVKVAQASEFCDRRHLLTFIEDMNEDWFDTYLEEYLKENHMKKEELPRNKESELYIQFWKNKEKELLQEMEEKGPDYCREKYIPK